MAEGIDGIDGFGASRNGMPRSRSRRRSSEQVLGEWVGNMNQAGRVGTFPLPKRVTMFRGRTRGFDDPVFMAKRLQPEAAWQHADEFVANG